MSEEKGSQKSIEEIKGIDTSEVRPTPKLDDIEGVRARLEEWLPSQLADVSRLTISDLEIPTETGMSNVTILFDMAYETSSGPKKQSLVGRIEPKGEKLVFPKYDLGLQYGIMHVVGCETDVPVPPLLAEDRTGDVLGMPFYIMVKVEGLVPPDMPPYHMDGWVCEATPGERETLWWSAVDAMAAFHKIDPASGKFAEFVAEFDFPKSLEEQLSYWEEFYSWGLEGRENKACKRAMQYLRDKQPADDNRRFCWGDSRMANVLFKVDKSGTAALLDWEMLTLGDPLQDLAWWIFMDELFSTGLGAERLEGIPGREETAKYWAEKTGYSADNLLYYLVFAGYRFSMLLARISVIQGNEDYLEESFAGNYLDSLY